MQGFGKEIVGYLDNNAKKMKDIAFVGKDTREFGKLGSVTGVQSKNGQKQSLYKEENLKAKLGVIIMADSDENHENRRLSNQKLPNS